MSSVNREIIQKSDLGIKNSVYLIVYISFLSTVTNFFPTSALLIFATPLIFIGRKKAPKFMAYLVAYAIFTILSVIIYDPSSFLEFDFYRRDGNFFISFAPLFALAYFQTSLNPESLIKTWLFFSLIVYVLAFILWYFRIWYSGDSPETFGGLFEARNAVGGFLSQVCCAAYVFARLKNKLFFFALAFFLLMIVATYSRGSILGFLFAVIIFEFVNRAKFLIYSRILMIGMFVSVFLVTLMIGFVNIGIYKETYARGVDYIGDAENGKEANIAIRAFFVWPKAVDNFLESPLLGLGFGSFDDDISVDRSIPGFAVASPIERVHSSAHAHNTFLHILAEQGLIGLFCFLAFVWSLYDFLIKIYSSRKDIVTGYLLASLTCIVFASFTEHRFFTPSMALPFTIFLAVYLSSQKR